MSKVNKKLNLNQAASEDFLNYATAVIKERAIPNIEDNLKPVHRRILYTLHNTKLTSDKKEKKSAATVGEVMKIHPHGDASIYDAMVRLGQDWKMRYPLITIQGNAGNINGSPAAAMRYTEAKLSPMGDYMVAELSEKGVEYMNTYDDEGQEPILLPSAIPNILINGNMGIAVGMSSSVLPHNLKESVDAIIAYINDPLLTVSDLIKIIPGPDLPTGGIITNIEKINEIYSTGRGTLKVEARYTIETKGRATHIVFNEIPYLVDLEKIVSAIKELAAEGYIDDVVDIQNNTGRAGLELRVILKRGANPNRTLQILFDKTGLRNNVRIGMTVLDNHKPVQTNMIGMIKGYVKHRHNVLINIYNEKLRKASARLHIVEGLMIAIQDIDGVVDLIKKSNSTAEARTGLIEKYKLTEEQAKAILNMRLSQLTRVDATALKDEKDLLEKDIVFFNKVLKEPKEREKIIKEQLLDIRNKFGDGRRTTLRSTLAVDENFVEVDYTVGLFEGSILGVVETSKLMQSGKNRVGRKIFEKEPLQVIQMSNKSKLLIVDEEGRMTAIPGSLLVEDEALYIGDLEHRLKTDIVSIAEYGEREYEKDYLVVFTEQNVVKRTLLADYKGFNAFTLGIKLRKGDAVKSLHFGNEEDCVIAVAEAKVNRYPLSEVRATGRTTIGVKAYDTSFTGQYTVANEKERVLMHGINNAKYVLVKDIPLGSRTNKGVNLDEDTTFVYRVKRTDFVIVNPNGTGYLINGQDVETKNYSHTNNNIYNGQISAIGY